MTNFWQTLQKPFLALAPMQDVTDFVFREVISEIAKPDVFFTEFVPAESLFSRGRDSAIRALRFSENQRYIVAQIWGDNPDTFYKTSQLVKEMGFDGIDINMGCPDKSVLKKNSGAALIKSPQLAKELIAAVRSGAGDMAVSVKTRIGFEKIVTNEWVSFLLEQKLDAITLHGRTAAQLSKVDANWDEIAAAVKLKEQIAPNTIIIGNGDVKSYKESLEKHSKYRVDGIMIGRGVFSNPWVFDKSDFPAFHMKKEYLNLLLHHAELFTNTWGSDKNFEIMKKFFKVYVNGFRGSAQLRDKLMKCKSYSEVQQLL